MARLIHEKSDVVPLVGEVFREFGYEGASFSRIAMRTGLGKGSLYHFFPGGKEEMGREVLAHVDAWFAREIFTPLERGAPHAAIEDMWRAVEDYFRSGRRICLVGAFALEETREPYAAEIKAYFSRWIAALRGALLRAGADKAKAKILAETAVGGIQGALVLARALDNPAVFSRQIEALRRQLEASLPAAGAGDAA
jgi:TetR/AcrR family transcriptional regulator, lmrAB and yxaGH operons repressor